MSDKQKVRVLVVDDEHDIVEILRLGLRKFGFDVDAFVDPRKALEAFKPNHYKAIILDIRMPGMNGIELAKEMQKTRPDIRIMVMTAYAEMNDEVHDNIPAIRKEDIVQKPFGIVQICSAVRKQLGRQS